MKNQSGYGAYSNVISRLAAGVPSAPTAVTLRTIGELTMRVAWSPPDDTGGGAAAAHPLMGYEVTLVQLGETEAVVLTRSEAPGTRQSEFTGLVRGTAYQVQVRAQNDALDDSGYGPAAVAAGQCADGVSRAGVCDAAGLVASGAASAPTGLELRVAGSGVIGVSFGVPGDTGDGTSTFPVLGYELEWEGRALGSGTVSAGGTVELGSGELEWSTTTLTGGIVVSVRVRARNAAGLGVKSQESLTTVVLPSPASSFSTDRDLLDIKVTFTAPRETGMGSRSHLVSYELMVSSPQSCGGLNPASKTISLDISPSVMTTDAFRFSVAALLGVPLSKGCT